MDLRILRVHLRPRGRRSRRGNPGRDGIRGHPRRTGTARSAAPARRTSRPTRASLNVDVTALRSSPARGLQLPLEALVFAVGMSTLGAEIAAQRLMAPFFGSSTVIWANTIAVVLLALSVGYWLGGRLADRRPQQRALCGLVLLGSALLAVVPFIAHPFLSLSVSAFDNLVGRRVHGLAVRDARAGRGAAAAARRGLAVGDAAEAGDGRGVRRRRGPPVRDLDDRLAGRRVLRLAVGDRGDRDPAHVPRPGRGAGARLRGGPRRALAARARAR